MNGAHGVTECLFVATREAGCRLQTDPVAVSTSSASGSLESSVYLARTGWLAGIEARGADGDFDGDVTICGLDIFGEQGAREHNSEANNGLDRERTVRIHVDLRCCQKNSGRKDRAVLDARSNRQDLPNLGERHA
jgi:hypothetical protein